MRKLTILFIALIATINSSAQSYIETIRGIADRSVDIRAFRSKLSADSLQQRLALNPEDPQLEVLHFQDNHTEASVNQSFRFPTVYIHQNKLSRLNINRAGIDYRDSYQKLLVEISEKYIELIYNSKIVALYNERAQRIDDYVVGVERAFEAGEQTLIDVENAKTLAYQMHTELIVAEADYEKSLNDLIRWSFADSTPTYYPNFAPITKREFVSTAIAISPELDAAVIDSIIGVRQLKLSRSQWYPNMRLGYLHQMADGVTGGAVIAGISVPLWQHKNNVRHSKAVLRNRKDQIEVKQIEVKTTLENLYITYESMESALKHYPRDSFDYIDLLRKSLIAGEITTTEFLLSVIDRFAVQQRYLEIEMEAVKSRAMMEVLMF